MKIVLAGGGTGGHVIPALAIAEELRNHGHDAAFVGTARGIETRLVPKAGFPLHLVKVGALNRVSLATRLRTLIDLPLSIFSAMRILRGFQAQVVIGVGGYAAGPATMAAVLLRIPVVLFEPNVVPGFANRAVARYAANAAVHFAQTGKWFRRFEVTGVPVRPAFFALPARQSPTAHAAGLRRQPGRARVEPHRPRLRRGVAPAHSGFEDRAPDRRARVRGVAPVLRRAPASAWRPTRFSTTWRSALPMPT